MFTKLHMCKSIKIKEAQNYQATAGTRTAGQLNCINVRDLRSLLRELQARAAGHPLGRGQGAGSSTEKLYTPIPA
jgi:hypothetical protein